jgi:CheY-like chemotaxis protein
MRIAYVEDNPTNLALVERVASMNQHTIVSYLEGEIALRELKTEKFDLILMDVELAGELSGLQVVRALRVGGLKTPVVAVTAYAMMGDRDKCLEAGCNDYLPKPLPIRELIDMLARYDTMVKNGDAIPVPMPVENSTTTSFSPMDHGDPDRAIEQPAPVAEPIGAVETSATQAAPPAPATGSAAAVGVAPAPTTETKTDADANPAEVPVPEVSTAPATPPSPAAPAPSATPVPVVTPNPAAPASTAQTPAEQTANPSTPPAEKPSATTNDAAESVKPTDAKPS